jgi:hypothetical protein
MINGKERIRFDCVGALSDPHILKCSNCTHEFRYQIDKETDLNDQENVAYLPHDSFEVIGIIEDPK